MLKVFLAAVGWFTVGVLIAATVLAVVFVLTVQILLTLSR